MTLSLNHHMVPTRLEDMIEEVEERLLWILNGDRTGICVCTDIAISAYYFCILKILCTLYWIYSQYSDKCWTCNESLQVPYRVIQDSVWIISYGVF